jgi:hypothetical protein
MEATANPSVLRLSSFAAFGLLLLLCALTLFSGVSQQWFESVHAPQVYSEALQRDAGWLRVIIVLDDLFIAAYVSATVALAAYLARGRWTVWQLLIVAGGVSAGVLDLQENHHLLTLLRVANEGLALPLAEVVQRSWLSQLKWLLGHVTFVLVGISLPDRGPFTRMLRVSLIAWQLPIGALTWAVDEGFWQTTLLWLRYGSFLAGFLAMPWLPSAGLRASLQGSQASQPTEVNRRDAQIGSDVTSGDHRL